MVLDHGNVIDLEVYDISKPLGFVASREQFDRWFALEQRDHFDLMDTVRTQDLADTYNEMVRKAYDGYVNGMSYGEMPVAHLYYKNR